MLHLNSLLREKHGALSKEGRKSRFTDPELYSFQKIGEINGALLREPAFKFFSPGRKLLGCSILFIPACSYQALVKEENDPLTQKFKETTTNALLQDESGSLQIVCPFAIGEETALTNVLLFYYHRLGIYRLEHSDQAPTKNKTTGEVLERVKTILRFKESSSPTSINN